MENNIRKIGITVGIPSPAADVVMMIKLRCKVLGMYIGCDVAQKQPNGQTLLLRLDAEDIKPLAHDMECKLVLTRLRDIKPEHEDVFVDFAGALRTVTSIGSNKDIETAVIAFSMAANRLRDMGYDCDGLIDAGLAIDSKLVTVNK